MPSILAQSMACAWAPAAVDRTMPQALRSLITRMVIAHIEAEIVLHVPDRTDQARYGSRLSDLLFVKELGDRPHLPLRGPLDDATQEEVGAAVTREFGDNVGVHRPPVPALRHDRAETRAETAVGPDAR